MKSCFKLLESKRHRVDQKVKQNLKGLKRTTIAIKVPRKRRNQVSFGHPG